MASASDSARRLRILVYANVERDEAGGAQAVVRSLCDHLCARGHRVSLGWNSATGTGKRDTGEWVQHFPVRAGQKRWLHLPTALRLLARLLRERPEVVNIHFASAAARYFQLFAPWLRFRTVLTCHGSDVLRPLRQDEPHLPAILAGADVVTAVSQDIAARIGAVRRGVSVAVIANGIDTDFWHPAMQTRPAKGSVTGRIVAVGRLERVKGFDLLIDALARLRTEGIEARLTLIGEGAERAALEQQVRAAQVADRVEFAGRLPREAVRARLQCADLFVLSSRSEGTPLALLEAMATGTACIATSVGGVPASAGTAVRLVAPENPAALSAAIAELLADRQARHAVANAARQRALAFDVGATHRAYEAIMLGLPAMQGTGSSAHV
ncbi:glycosyltransferase family 4 protein [Erythrobacter sp. NFXS35]|uniref:glycosyltransferase family 4 protein n=1 Tax=Erythrobacter sp. NFXS35 TaxID=2818436 RepID=UPI0032DE8A1A